MGHHGMPSFNRHALHLLFAQAKRMVQNEVYVVSFSVPNIFKTCMRFTQVFGTRWVQCGAAYQKAIHSCMSARDCCLHPGYDIRRRRLLLINGTWW